MSIKEKPLEPDLRHAWLAPYSVPPCSERKLCFCSVFLKRSVAKDR